MAAGLDDAHPAASDAEDRLLVDALVEAWAQATGFQQAGRNTALGVRT
jgi:hypothetical protein